MLLLPGTVLDSAVTFAERVRKRIEAHTFSFPGGSLSRTASFGVSGWPHPRIKECDALVRAADDALYVAKEMGRNRVVRFDGPDYDPATAGDAFAPESTVCWCNGVTVDTITASAAAGNDTVACIGSATRAGTGCRGCKGRIGEVLERFAAQSVP